MGSVNCIIVFVLLFNVNSLSYSIVREYQNKPYHLGNTSMAFSRHGLKVPCVPGCVEAQLLLEDRINL